MTPAPSRTARTTGSPLRSLASVVGLAVLATTATVLVAPAASAAPQAAYTVGGSSTAVAVAGLDNNKIFNVAVGTSLGEARQAQGEDYNLLLGYTLAAQASDSVNPGAQSLIDYDVRAASNETGAAVPPPPPYDTTPPTNDAIFDGYAALGATSGTVSLRATPGSGQCGPEAQPVVDSTTSITDFTMRPVDFDADGVGDFPLIEAPGTHTVTTRSSLVPNGTAGTRGATSTAQGPTGTYELMDGEVVVEVTAPSILTVAVDGLGPSTYDYRPATATATAHGSTVPVVPGVPLTIPSQDRPGLEVTVNIPTTPDSFDQGSDMMSANAYVNAFRAEYFEDDNNPNTGSLYRGYVAQGRLRAMASVPAGGVVCLPEPVVTPTPTSTTPTPPTPAPTLVPALDPSLDTDGDGLTDRREQRLGTDPFDKDTDGDRLSDGREVKGLGVKDLRDVRTDPLAKDTDGDGLRDGREVRGFRAAKGEPLWRSHPLRKDTDRDGLRDKVEVSGKANRAFGKRPTNPWDKDTDGDGVRDKAEIDRGSNPTRSR